MKENPKRRTGKEGDKTQQGGPAGAIASGGKMTMAGPESKAEAAAGPAANAPVPASLEEVRTDKNVFSLIQAVRAGVDFSLFQELATEATFSWAEWSNYLHLSERTLQRYKKEEATFAPPQSEKILEIMLLLEKGIAVFGDKDTFHAWLDATHVALGNVKPKDLLDSSFGINLLQDELTRIESGVFA